MSLNLNELETKLDQALEAETPESSSEWIQQKRKLHGGLLEFVLREDGQEATPENIEWANKFLTGLLSEGIKTGHFGDCTDQPQTCNLCLLENLLAGFYCNQKLLLGTSRGDKLPPIASYKIPEIFKAIEAVTGVNQEKILSRSRLVEIARARAVFAVIAREVLKMKLTSIGRILGRDHSTIIHLVSLFSQSHIRSLYFSVRKQLTEIQSP